MSEPIHPLPQEVIGTNAAPKKPSMSTTKIIATVGTAVAAVALLVTTLIKSNQDAGEGSPSLAATLGEHAYKLAVAEEKLNMLVAEDADDQLIFDAISELNKEGRLVYILSRTLGGKGSSAPALDFLEASDAISNALPIVDDEKIAKPWVRHQAQHMKDRAMLVIAEALADEGKVKVTSSNQDGSSITLVDGRPLEEWYLSQKKDK